MAFCSQDCSLKEDQHSQISNDFLKWKEWYPKEIQAEVRPEKGWREGTMGLGGIQEAWKAISYYLSGQIIHSHLPSALPKQSIFLLLFWKEITFRQWHQYPASWLKAQDEDKMISLFLMAKRPTPPRKWPSPGGSLLSTFEAASKLVCFGSHR